MIWLKLLLVVAMTALTAICLVWALGEFLVWRRRLRARAAVARSPVVLRRGSQLAAERDWRRSARSGSILMLLVVMAGCGTRPVNVPEQVPVVVTKFREFPVWATEPLPIPALRDSTIDAHLDREDALGEWARRASCHRSLLARLGRGESVNPQDCKGGVK